MILMANASYDTLGDSPVSDILTQPSVNLGMHSSFNDSIGNNDMVNYDPLSTGSVSSQSYSTLSNILLGSLLGDNELLLTTESDISQTNGQSISNISHSFEGAIWQSDINKQRSTGFTDNCLHDNCGFTFDQPTLIVGTSTVK